MQADKQNDTPGAAAPSPCRPPPPQPLSLPAERPPAPEVWGQGRAPTRRRARPGEAPPGRPAPAARSRALRAAGRAQQEARRGAAAVHKGGPPVRQRGSPGRSDRSAEEQAQRAGARRPLAPRAGGFVPGPAACPALTHTHSHAAAGGPAAGGPAPLTHTPRARRPLCARPPTPLSRGRAPHLTSCASAAALARRPAGPPRPLLRRRPRPPAPPVRPPAPPPARLGSAPRPARRAPLTAARPAPSWKLVTSRRPLTPDPHLNGRAARRGRGLRWGGAGGGAGAAARRRRGGGARGWSRGTWWPPAHGCRGGAATSAPERADRTP